ncbi:MAG: hypothetical protein OXD33_00670 [Rhodobacteraceae bacterium]|nr:hypothetical protein [Paracoccaceae bacterium]
MDGGGVSISGEANFGVKFAESDDDSKSELQFHHEFDIKFSASGTTDGGIGFGGSVSIDNRESVSLAKTTATPAVPARKVTAGFAVVTTAQATANDAASRIAIGDYTIEGSGTAAGTLGEKVFKRPDGITVGDILYLQYDSAGKNVTGIGKIDITPGTGDNAAALTLAAQQEALKKLGWRADTAAGPDGTLGNEDDILGTTLYQIGPSTVNVPPATEAKASTVLLGPKDTHKVDNHAEVYISMDMHKLTIGTDLDRADQLAGGLNDPGFDGIGIDDVAEAVWGKTARDVRYDGDFGVAKVAITYGDNKGDAEWAAGFSFDVAPVTMGAGFDSNGVMSIGLGFTQGQIGMKALYSTDSDSNEADDEASKITAAGSNSKAIDVERDNAPDLKNQAMGVELNYQMSEDTSLLIVAAQHKSDSASAYYDTGEGGALVAGTAADGQTGYKQKWVKSSTTKDAFGVGFSHDLGGGATLKAGAGSVDSNAVADLGITMKF